MNTKEEARRIIARSSISINAIAKRANLSHHTVSGVADGTGNPTLETLDAIFSVITLLPGKKGHDCKTCRFYGGSNPDAMASDGTTGEAAMCELTLRLRAPSGCAGWDRRK